MSVRCTGITKAGVRCAKVATRSLGEGEREWCPQHAPEDAVKDIPPCAGLLRNGTPCPSAPAGIAVFQGEEVPLCRQHLTVHAETDGRSVQTPPKPRTPKTKRIAQPSEVVESTEENGSGRSRHQGTLRERLVTSTEELYEQIHSALEDTIINAQKRRATACPSCGHRFSVLIPDYGAIVSAANTLLAKTVASTSTLEEEAEKLESTPPEELAELTTAQLKRLLRHREWSTVQMEAQAGTLQRTVSRHLGTLADYADDPDPDDLPKARFAKRDVERLRGIAVELQPLLRVELPLLPGETPPYEGRRPTLDGSHREKGDEPG